MGKDSRSPVSFCRRIKDKIHLYLLLQIHFYIKILFLDRNNSLFSHGFTKISFMHFLKSFTIDQVMVKRIINNKKYPN